MEMGDEIRIESIRWMCSLKWTCLLATRPTKGKFISLYIQQNVSDLPVCYNSPLYLTKTEAVPPMCCDEKRDGLDVNE